MIKDAREQWHISGNVCVRLRSDFHNFIEPETASFRRCSEKSAVSGSMKFENHLARPRAAHFRIYAIVPGLFLEML